jgi:hypothetical protein
MGKVQENLSEDSVISMIIWKVKAVMLAAGRMWSNQDIV